jgi:hypothetical protein
MNTFTRVSVAAMGLMFALGGMSHGFFASLQGNTPTDSILIDAIGANYQTWEYGGEAAMTLVPNFLVTGILAMLAGLAIMIWSIEGLHRKHGATIFLLLFIVLVLVGGGIGQIPFFLLAWAVATRINQPLTWWRRTLPVSLRRVLAPLWSILLIASILPILLALEIAIFGFVPGVTDADQMMNIVLGLLGIGLLSFVLTALAAFSRDISATERVTMTTA